MGKDAYNRSSEWDGPNACGPCFLRIRTALEHVENRLESKSMISLQERYQYQENHRNRENKTQVHLPRNFLSHKSSQHSFSMVDSDIAQFNQSGPFIQTQQDTKYHLDLSTELGAEINLFVRILDSMRNLQVSNPQPSLLAMNEKALNDSVTNDLESRENLNKLSSFIAADSFLSNNGFALQKWAASPGTLFKRTWKKIIYALRRISRPRIRLGYRRIEWVCVSHCFMYPLILVKNSH